VPYRKRVAAGVLATVMAVPGVAWGFVGGPGCTNLPLYHRALGALQGMTSACDMSVEEARRIIAEHDGPAAAPEPVDPGPRGHHGRRKDRPPQR